MIMHLPRLVAAPWHESRRRRHRVRGLGIAGFISIGLLYSYRYVWRAKGWMELAYGLGGLFIMGLGIRAVLQVTA